MTDLLALPLFLLGVFALPSVYFHGPNRGESSTIPAGPNNLHSDY